MEHFFRTEGLQTYKASCCTRARSGTYTRGTRPHSTRTHREFLSDLRTVSQQQAQTWAQSLDLYTRGRCHTALPEPDHPPLTQHMP